MSPPEPATAPSLPPEIAAIERPHGDLMTYYLLRSLVLGPLFPVLLLPLWFRYHTLRYRLDEEGISMAWGILFRREIHLTYARIQDIHLVSNVVERWLGLARIQIQTASGSAKAEMALEGLKDFQRIRDYLYARMRGTSEHPGPHSGTHPENAPAGPSVVPRGSGSRGLELGPETVGELTAALREVAAGLRTVQQRLERLERGGGERADV
jgi:putative membrane protein